MAKKITDTEKIKNKKSFDIKSKILKKSPQKKEIVKEQEKKVSKKKNLFEVIKNKIIKKKAEPKSVFKKIKDSLSEDKKNKLKNTKKQKVLIKHEDGIATNFGKVETLKLHRSINNPIIEPRPYDWESKATFNPTAFIESGKIHLIYRAIGWDDVSTLGYASSFDGYHIEERPTYHVYKRFHNNDVNKNTPKLLYTSGTNWNGGCEDPRIVLIEDTLYMIYVSFDGWSSVRLALTSISLSDFKKRKWDNWSKPVLISPPGQINKNWVLFPEKINGKFAILHSFYPKILIDYFDNLDYFDGNNFIKSNNTRPVDKTRNWDSWFRGVGPAPIKIKEGWLILYHAMDHKNPDRYKLGALILDEKDLTKVLYRSEGPILEPEEEYENNGHKWGVVYSCGAVVRSGRLFVYYGGADTVVCVASIELNKLINYLKEHKLVKLKKVKLLKSNKLQK